MSSWEDAVICPESSCCLYIIASFALHLNSFAVSICFALLCCLLSSLLLPPPNSVAHAQQQSRNRNDRQQSHDSIGPSRSNSIDHWRNNRRACSTNLATQQVICCRGSSRLAWM